jgi:hypothetical protein
MLNIVNTNTVDDLLNIPPRNKNPGVSDPESVGAIALIRPSQSSAVEISHQEIP